MRNDNSISVKSASGLTGSGSRDWFLQRASAVVLALYSIVMVGFFLFNQVDYQAWRGFMMSFPMKIFTLVSLLALVFHAWVGMWTVLTDYVKSSGMRVVLQGLVIIAILMHLFGGIIIFWG